MGTNFCNRSNFDLKGILKADHTSLRNFGRVPTYQYCQTTDCHTNGQVIRNELGLSEENNKTVVGNTSKEPHVHENIYETVFESFE